MVRPVLGTGTEGRPGMATLLEIENLQVRFPSGDAVVQAVDGISYSVGEGETVAVVGESGCGRAKMSAAVPYSTMRPAYMTLTRSA